MGEAALAHKDECQIMRIGAFKIVRRDGEQVFAVNAMFSNDQVWEILAQVNLAYDRGVQAGKLAKAAEIRGALGVVQ